MGLIKTIVWGRENGTRAWVRRTLFGDRFGDRPPASAPNTSPNSAYSAPGPDGGISSGGISSGGISSGGVIVGGSNKMEPPKDVTPPDGFEVVLHKDALKPGEITEVIIGGTAIAVANVAGTYRAISNACPHAGGPLGEGTLEGGAVRCPYHGWTYDLESGACKTNPDVRVQTYEVRVERDAVCVRL
ncbi:MAG: Rieske (2Fe-2S) protein [Myxococcota bacterium]